MPTTVSSPFSIKWLGRCSQSTNISLSTKRSLCKEGKLRLLGCAVVRPTLYTLNSTFYVLFDISCRPNPRRRRDGRFSSGIFRGQMRYFLKQHCLQHLVQLIVMVTIWIGACPAPLGIRSLSAFQQYLWVSGKARSRPRMQTIGKQGFMRTLRANKHSSASFYTPLGGRCKPLKAISQHNWPPQIRGQSPG